MTTNKSERNTYLKKLSGSDFELADGQPDIRGWDVKDDAGKTIGEVDELIFDEQTMKVRYLVLDVDKNELNLDNKDILVPIGVAELDKHDDDVLLPGITTEQLRNLPEYNEDSFDNETEKSILSVFGGAGAGAAAGLGADFYNHGHFNEDNLYRRRQKDTEGATIPVIQEDLQVGKREVETGGVRLRSRIVEQPVSEDITLRQEHVNVERTPVDRPASEKDFAGLEREVEMRQHEEVPVVSKDSRVIEEISLTKDVEERDETIRETLRSTEVDVDENNRKSGYSTGYRD